MAALFGFALVGLAAVWERSALTAANAGPPASSPQEQVEVRVRAVVASEDGELNAVLLAPDAGEPLLPVFVERAEADAIVARLTDEADGVPHPAEALRAAIGSLGGSVERASIVSVEPLASEGRLLLKENERTFELPAAGALCIELSIAEKVPLLVDKQALEKLGISRAELDAMGDGEPAGPGEPPGPGEAPPKEPGDPDVKKAPL